MATLGLTTTLLSSNVQTDKLSMTLTDSLVTTEPSRGLSRETITTADNQEILDNALSAAMYVYVKNLDPTNFVILQTTASEVWGRLNPGEFIFFCIAPSIGLEVRADTASCIVEYAYWTKA